nr:MAG TPA: hypothetical protein [Caudoviricetes sp.]
MYQSEVEKWPKNRGFRPRTNALKPFFESKQRVEALGLMVWGHFFEHEFPYKKNTKRFLVFFEPRKMSIRVILKWSHLR